MYILGFILNFICYQATKIQSDLACDAGVALCLRQPGFFEGYSIAAVLVIICNSMIGIAVTYVYKYADNIMKNIATNLSTAVLYILGIMVFGVTSKVLGLVGYVIVFLSTILYVLPPPKPRDVFLK